MMEKRNFVTSMRTPGCISAVDVDDIVGSAVSAVNGEKLQKKASSDFEQKAMAEDEKSDAEAGGL